jgi:hypothetical protein
MGSEGLRNAMAKAAMGELARRQNSESTRSAMGGAMAQAATGELARKNTTEVAPNPQEAALAGTEGVTKKRKELFPAVKGKSATTLSPSQITLRPTLLGN